jgi:hypothetical protein
MIKKLYASQGLQGIFTLAYLYIIVLGILGEALYYSQIDINILNYSSITDVLLSPISKLTSHFILVIIIVGLLLTMFTISGLEQAQKEKFKRAVKFDGTPKSIDGVVMFFALFLFSFYIGLDFGFGYLTSMKIKKKEIKYEDHVQMPGEEPKPSKIVGINSGFLFYLKEGETRVVISPLGAVQSFDRKPKIFKFKKTK